MRSRRKAFLWICLIAALTIFPSAAESDVEFEGAYHTRADVRARYESISDWRADQLFTEPPSAAAPYRAGALDENALSDALDQLNFLRWLAYLDRPVELNPLYTLRAQHASVLLARLQRLAHDAENPGDMPADFYETAHNGTMSSNIAALNWMNDEILRTGLEFFARDDGEQNLPTLGHRRWLLNPLMAETGFGLANSDAGVSYVAMYAHDLGNADAEWDAVCWPSAGAFPADYMREALAWSITLNPVNFDLAASKPVIELTETGTGAIFTFDSPNGACGAGVYYINTERYGAGPCLIFLPDLAAQGVEEYRQNQRWRVRVNGLVDFSGSPVPMEYTVEMISLYPIDPASIEISRLSAEMKVGETLALSASVVPDWADDLSVAWSSDHPEICEVDAAGRVTARAAGACQITAQSVNGRTDACAVNVTE